MRAAFDAVRERRAELDAIGLHTAEVGETGEAGEAGEAGEGAQWQLAEPGRVTVGAGVGETRPEGGAGEVELAMAGAGAAAQGTTGEAAVAGEAAMVGEAAVADEEAGVAGEAGGAGEMGAACAMALVTETNQIGQDESEGSFDMSYGEDMEIEPVANESEIVPASVSTKHVMQAAMQQTQTEFKQRNFKLLLGGMKAVESITLRASAGAIGALATVVAQTGGSYLLVHEDKAFTPEVVAIDEADTLLAARFDLPAPSKTELSIEEAAAVRKRQARQAAAQREAEQRAAVQAARDLWYRQQGELADELGLTFDDWQRIVALLSKPPPIRVGDKLVMCSVAIGREVVIDAAVEEAVAAPLHESVRASAERSAKQTAAPKGGGLTQTTFGQDVSEMLPLLEEAEHTASTAATEKRQRQRGEDRLRQEGEKR